MNKIIGNKRFYLVIAILFAVTLMFSLGPVCAQDTGTLVIDSFEYWDNPQNMGWQIIHPGLETGYPVWGMGLGIGQLQTLIDFQEGSRVLEAYMPATLMVPNIQRMMIRKAIQAPADYSVLSLKLRSPVAIETFDTVEVVAVLQDGTSVQITPKGMNYMVTDPEGQATLDGDVVKVTAGRDLADGSWHLFNIDLAKALSADKVGKDFATAGPVVGIIIIGNQYRADDIELKKADAVVGAGILYMFHVNHIYTQLYGKTIRYMYASDDGADSILPTVDAAGNVNPGNTMVLATLNKTSLADENAKLFIENTEVAIGPALSTDDYIAAIEALGDTFAEDRLTDPSATETVNIGDGGAAISVARKDLYPIDVPLLLTMPSMIAFRGSVGGAHEQGTPLSPDICGNLPLAMQPPDYHPLYKKVSPMTGEGYLGPDEVLAVYMSLLQAGAQYWPTVGMVAIPGEQVIENMVITVVATNGMVEDLESFMLTTLNYPVTNYPPVIEDVDDVLFSLGAGTQRAILNATDADSLTRDVASMGQTRPDMAQLTWTATLEGLPAYMYGPWTQSLINPKTGVVSIDAQFEGGYQMVVTVRDPKGAQAVAAFTVYCIQGNTWLNHPPIMLRDWEHPVIGQAGKELSLALDGIVDPDGEPLSFSCNIGVIGNVNGKQVWQLKTHYPGTYLVEIVAFDIRGGYLVIPQEVVIIPWWPM